MMENRLEDHPILADMDIKRKERKRLFTELKAIGQRNRSQHME
jgi:hypothetical protein